MGFSFCEGGAMDLEDQCHWCDKPSVACITIRTNRTLPEPYQGQTEYQTVEVIRACPDHKYLLDQRPTQ